MHYHYLIHSHNKNVYLTYNPHLFDHELYKKIWKYIWKSETFLSYKEAVHEMYKKKLINISDFNKLYRCVYFSLPCQYSIDNNKIGLKLITCEMCPIDWVTKNCKKLYYDFERNRQVIIHFNREIERYSKYINYEYVIEAKKRYRKIAKLFFNAKLKPGIKYLPDKFQLI